MTSAVVAVTGTAGSVRSKVENLLRAAGYQVTLAADEEETLRRVRTRSIELLVLCPPLGQAPIEKTTKRLRRLTQACLLVIAPKEPSNKRKIAAFKSGADDFLEDPFDPEELVARAEALVRRARRSNPEEEVLDGGDIIVDRRGAEVVVRGRITQLPLKEFQLLATLVENRGTVLSRADLIAAVWGNNYDDLHRTLDVHIKRLRTRIERNPHRPRHLLTVRGIGYKFSP